SLARVTQDHAQDPRSATTALSIDHWSSGAKIHLDLLPGLNLDPPHSLGLFVTKLTYETFDRLIRAAERNLAHQILINPSCAQSRIEFGINAGPIGITQTGSASFDFQHRQRHVCGSLFAGGRNGGF